MDGAPDRRGHMHAVGGLQILGRQHLARVALGDPAAVDLKALRVAFHCDNGLQQPTPEIVAALQSAALTLAGAGLLPATALAQAPAPAAAS